MAACCLANQATAAPFDVGGDPRVDPSRFRVTTFATGLNFPYGMQSMSDGGLLVATSKPTTTSLFNSTGQLVRLVDADHDGQADGPGTVLYTGLPGVATGLLRAGDLWMVTSVQSGQERISVLRAGATPADPLSLAGELRLAFPSPWQHKSYGLALLGSPSPGQYEVAFNVGSQFNFAPSTGSVTTSGLATTTLAGDSVYRARLSDLGGSVTLDQFEQLAHGLRNAAALAVNAGGDLYLADNGIDSPANPAEPLSADELDRIPAANLGGPAEDFGFPNNYVEYRTGTVVGGGGVAPLVAFQPLGNPLTGSESEGPASLSLAPIGFPQSLRDGLFVGFHGQSASAGVANEENPLVFVDPTSGQYFDFISNAAPLGHPDGLLAVGRSLFVSDLSTAGPLTGAGGGAIYQITYLGPQLLGDANDDCTVGAADYAIWSAEFGQSGPGLPADFDGDGSVGAGDYTLWAANFGKTCLPPTAGVPEPSSGALLALAMLVLLVRHQRGDSG